MKRKVAARPRSRQPKRQNGNLLIEVGRTIGTALGAAAVRAEQAREEAQKAVSAAGAELKQTAARTIGTALGAAAVRAEQAREVAQRAASAAGAELKQTAARTTAQLKRKIGAAATPKPATRKKARKSAPRRKKVASRSRKTR